MKRINCCLLVGLFISLPVLFYTHIYAPLPCDITDIHYPPQGIHFPFYADLHLMVEYPEDYTIEEAQLILSCSKTWLWQQLDRHLDLSPNDKDYLYTVILLSKTILDTVENHGEL